jgi:hypothetical protein
VGTGYDKGTTEAVAQGCTVPETEEQKGWLREHASIFGLNMGIDIQDFDSSHNLYVCSLLVFAGFGLYFWWRLLNRLSRYRTFCVWHPTLMLIIYSALLFALDAYSGTKYDAFLQAVALLMTIINSPGLIPVGAFLGIIFWLSSGKAPVWILMAVAVTLFWLSWYLFLRYLRNRTIENAPCALNLTSPVAADRKTHRDSTSGA